jgi:hypothetical protein
LYGAVIISPSVVAGRDAGLSGRGVTEMLNRKAIIDTYEQMWMEKLNPSGRY